ncbi:MAG: hypothetical protein Kow0013_06040 [Pararhodobacter sp.]
MLPQLLQIPAPPLPVAGARARPTGLLAGTLVRTTEGEMPVEFLLAGDRICTPDGPLELRGTSVLAVTEADVVVFTPGEGDNRPDRALTLPASQPVVLRDWRAQLLHGRDAMLTPASSLVDDVTVTRERRQNLRLVRLHFDAPQVIWANGMQLASARRRAPGRPTLAEPPSNRRLLH